MSRVVAFLSHASVDKRFVTPVAQRLGRQRALLDAREFQTGESFVSEIRRTLSDSTAFVLFVSKASLDSFWVRFEINEADQLLREQQLRKALVLIIDRHVSFRDLPAWMQRMKIESIYSPNAAARLIEHNLRELRGFNADTFFVGRESLLSELSAKLIPSAEDPAPHVVIVSGLSGSGRKTFLRRALQDFLGVRTGAMLLLRTTDGLDTLHLLLVNELGALDTKEQWTAAIEDFRAATPDARAEMLADLLQGAAEGNVAPIIVDDGALLDASGRYTEDFWLVFEALLRRPDIVVGLVHTRRPSISSTELERLGGCFIRVPPLDTRATKALLQQSLRALNITATAEQLSTLVPYLDGYPPAVKIAAGTAQEYGIAAVVADTSGLVNFQLRAFASTLERLHLSPTEWSILKTIASGLALPLDALALGLEEPEDKISESLRRLIDLNLVLPSEETYSIALPIRFAVNSLQGLLNAENFDTLGHRLKKLYWDGTDKVPPLSIVQATIQTLIRAGSPELADFKGFVVPSMLFRVAKEQIEEGGSDNWRRGLDLLKQLQELEPRHRAGTLLRAKMEARLSHWAEAEKSLDQIRSFGWVDQHSIEGFIAWKRHKYGDAIAAYRKAIALNQSSVDIYHALASCLIRDGDYPAAKKVIEDGLKGRRPNPLLIDLAAQIAIIQADYQAAQGYIDQLFRLNALADYSFRSAALLCALHQYEEALPHAREAVRLSRKRYELDATLADILIGVREFGEAKDLLDALDHRERFDQGRTDVRKGLRCKWHIKQRDWPQAEVLWESLEHKQEPVHQALRLQILELKAADLTVSPGVRAVAHREIAALRQVLGEEARDHYLDFDSDSDMESFEGIPQESAVS